MNSQEYKSCENYAFTIKISMNHHNNKPAVMLSNSMDNGVKLIRIQITKANVCQNMCKVSV